MILDIVHWHIDRLVVQFLIVFICWLIVLFAVAIDFYFGVKKSKANGRKYVHSYGIKRSGKKLIQYLAVMAFMLFMDVLNPLWVYTELQPLPIFTMIGCLIWVWTERKSVMEKFEDKIRHDYEDNAKDIIDTVKSLRADLKDITSDLAEIKENERRILSKRE